MVRRFGFPLAGGLARGGVIIAVNAALWFRLAADRAAVVHRLVARLAQDSHALMNGFFGIAGTSA